jgi:hypothetical protein
MVINVAHLSSNIYILYCTTCTLITIHLLSILYTLHIYHQIYIFCTVQHVHWSPYTVHVVQYRIYIFDDKCATCTTEAICVWWSMYMLYSTEYIYLMINVQRVQQRQCVYGDQCTCCTVQNICCTRCTFIIKYIYSVLYNMYIDHHTHITSVVHVVHLSSNIYILYCTTCT